MALLYTVSAFVLWITQFSTTPLTSSGLYKWCHPSLYVDIQLWLHYAVVLLFAFYMNKASFSLPCCPEGEKHVSSYVAPQIHFKDNVWLRQPVWGLSVAGWSTEQEHCITTISASITLTTREPVKMMRSHCRIIAEDGTLSSVIASRLRWCHWKGGFVSNNVMRRGLNGCHLCLLVFI